MEPQALELADCRCMDGCFFILEKIIAVIKGGKYMKSKGFDYFVLTLVIIGAINWGLIGFFKFDLVAFLFGQMTWLSRIVYAIVGISSFP